MTQLRCYISKFLGKESRKSMAIISISCKKNSWRTSVWQCDYYELHWRVIAPGTCGNGRIKLGAEPGNMLIPTVIWSAAQSTRSPALPRRRFLHALPRSTLGIVLPWAHAFVSPLPTLRSLEISLTQEVLWSAAAKILVNRPLLVLLEPSSRWGEPFILECSGQNSCDKDFDVENVGSMCVTGDNAVGPNQQTGTFRLADADPDTGRINDVCCARPFRQTTGGGAGANQPHCSSATFENVGSMYCTGDNSCNNLQVTLSGESWMQQRLLMLDC